MEEQWLKDRVDDVDDAVEWLRKGEVKRALAVLYELRTSIERHYREQNTFSLTTGAPIR